MKFITGKTYQTRSIGDYNCIFRMEVLSRTEKTIQTYQLGKAKTLRIKINNGVEFVKPLGSYSMCPIITAEKLAQA